MLILLSMVARASIEDFRWSLPRFARPICCCAMLNRYITLLAFVAINLALAASQTPASNPAISGGSGSSHKTAIVVHASSAAVGIRAQDAYLKAHYPGYRFVGHAFTAFKGRWYDIVLFTDARGKKRSLYFDISDYFKPMSKFDAFSKATKS